MTTETLGKTTTSIKEFFKNFFPALGVAFSPRTIVKDLSDLELKDGIFLAILMSGMIFALSYWGSGPLEWVSSLTGVMCVFLVARRKMSNFFWGVINTATYTYFAYNAAYYGDTMLFGGFYFPYQFICAVFWYRNLTGEEVISRKLTSPITALTLLVVSALLVSLYAWALQSIGNNLPAFDAFTTVGSILASWFMLYGYREQWPVWVAINMSSIYMWWTAYNTPESTVGLGLAAMWSVYLLNSMYGWFVWYRASRQN